MVMKYEKGLWRKFREPKCTWQWSKGDIDRGDGAWPKEAGVQVHGQAHQWR